VGLVLELLVWWVATTGVWIVSLSAYASQDLIAALACGLPCAILAVLARRAVRLAARPPGELLRWLAALPWSIAVDTARVLALPWRPKARSTAGEFRRMPIGPPGTSAAAVGRRSAAALLMSSTPGAYVVDVDPDTGTALVHAVGPQSLIERQVGA
jgi:multisubunit Na+/H+ antiporter MnhE subunit